MKYIQLIFISLLTIMVLTSCTKQTEEYFTEEDAVNAAKSYYEDSQDIFFVCVDNTEYIDGKKVYQVCVKSENQMLEGGSGTISVIKINEDGKILN